LQYNVRAVTPELPDPSEWIKFLKPAIDENWYTNYGPVNTHFEKRLSALYGQMGEGVVTSSSATSGLSACLIAEAISGPVLCPAFTFQATAAAILGANCKPVIVDVDEVSGVVSAETLEYGFQKIGAKAAIVVAPYGITNNFQAHAEVCRKLGKLLIIDNAAGLGVARGQSALSGKNEAVREVFSLHATKPFGVGEGCAIFAPYSKVPSLRAAMNFGLQSHSANGEVQRPYWGINGKMSEVHAAIGLAVADGMAQRVASRQEMARNWIEFLKDSPAVPFHTTIDASPWQVLPILLESQINVVKTMENAAKHKIELRRYYTPSLGTCQGMEQLSRCPNAQNLAERVLALPVRSFMAIEEQYKIMSTVRACIAKSQNRVCK